MADLNKVQLIGNITSDLEMKSTPSGVNVVSFSVATNRTYKDSEGEKHEQAEFTNIVLWSKLAEIADKYVKKGHKIYIEGRLQTRSWEAKDGSKRYKTEVIGENMIMLNSKGGASHIPDTSDYSGKVESDEDFAKKVKEDKSDDIAF